MTNVAGHLREQNGIYQMILSWKDTDGKRRTKSIIFLIITLIVATEVDVP